MVYACPHQMRGHCVGQHTDHEEIGERRRRSPGGPENEVQPAFGENFCVWPKTLADLLYMFPCCPPESFYNVKEFFNNPILNKLDDNCKVIRVALRNWCAKIRLWTVADFNSYYSDSNVRPYFNAYNADN